MAEVSKPVVYLLAQHDLCDLPCVFPAAAAAAFTGLELY